MMTISVTIATKNESENILQCLKSVPFADEIVVIDDCSVDDTVEKAKRLGARVIIRDSRGSFHENKNLAITEANCEWVLSLDADEFVSAQLGKSIQMAIQNAEVDGYLVDRHNYFLGRWIKGCGWYPDHILRLFRKGKAWWPVEIHDTPRLQGGNRSVPLLKGPLIHNTYKNFEQYFDKFNRYTTRLAVEHAEHHESMEGLHFFQNLFLRPGFWFFRKYFFLAGFKDGLLGFFISLSSGLTIFVSYLKFLYTSKGEMSQHGGPNPD
jgi:glycosyltransferase involved in cell wall biosynthesis